MIEDKRFKIKKKTSYQELINKEKKSELKSATATFLGSLATVYFLASAQSNPDFIRTISLIPATLSITGMTQFIKAVCKKTMYESKLEDINMQLEMLENAN